MGVESVVAAPATYVAAPSVVASPTSYVVEPVRTSGVQAIETITAPVSYAAPSIVGAVPSVVAAPAVSYSPVASPRNSLFDRIDKNHDGVITRAEMKGWRLPTQ